MTEFVLLLKSAEGGMAAIYSILIVKRLSGTRGFCRRLLAVISFWVLWLGVVFYFTRTTKIGAGIGRFSPFEMFMESHETVSSLFYAALITAFFATTVYAWSILLVVVRRVLRKIKGFVGVLAYSALAAAAVAFISVVIYYVRYMRYLLHEMDIILASAQGTFIFTFVLTVFLLSVCVGISKLDNGR